MNDSGCFFGGGLAAGAAGFRGGGGGMGRVREQPERLLRATLVSAALLELTTRGGELQLELGALEGGLAALPGRLDGVHHERSFQRVIAEPGTRAEVNASTSRGV